MHNTRCGRVEARYVIDGGTVTPAAEAIAADALALYPNPVTERIYLRIPRGFSDSAYTISDATGRRVASGRIANDDDSASVELSGLDLPAGSYYLQLDTGTTERSLPFLVAR